jgi:hypothetical protein
LHSLDHVPDVRVLQFDLGLCHHMAWRSTAQHSTWQQTGELGSGEALSCCATLQHSTALGSILLYTSEPMQTTQMRSRRLTT